MINLKKPILDENEFTAVLDVMRSGVVAQGPRVKEFETSFADKCGTNHAIAVNSGTAALHCALYAIGIKEGDEVICPAFSFIATATPILMCRAKPVFVDIDYDSFNIDVQKIEDAISNNTRAIIAVNLFGRLADWSELRRIADKYKLKLVEDAAQSHFAMAGGTCSGAFGDIGCFSFYATKNMMTGEGGMIVTNDKSYDDKCRRFRQHGMSGLGMYDYLDYGFNYRTTDINAAIGLCQLQKIDLLNKKRIEIAKNYNAAFENLIGLSLPYSSYNGEHVYHLFTIGLPNFINREKLINSLKEKGVGCGVYYPTPLNELSIFEKIGSNRDMEISKAASNSVITIPCEPWMSESEQSFVIDTFKGIYNSLA